MERIELQKLLNKYNINNFSSYTEVDSSKLGDYRLNIIIDNRYVLRINHPVITEERLSSISRLCERYRDIGIMTPLIYRNDQGRFITEYGKRICYLSDYLDYPLQSELDSCNETQIQNEVLRSVGVFSAKYSGVDLSPVNSMWSIIDLAPLDTDVDEHQENLDTLVDGLKKLGETDLAKKVIMFNEEKRANIKSVYKDLPRCVIQGDLNPTNILVKDNHFVGLIDFNLAGTEVNVNHFCNETNEGFDEDGFSTKTAEALYWEWTDLQNKKLEIILSEYSLNELEKIIIDDYRSICLISQYPNVMAYLHFLKIDKEKTVKLIELILER